MRPNDPAFPPHVFRPGTSACGLSKREWATVTILAGMVAHPSHTGEADSVTSAQAVEWADRVLAALATPAPQSAPAPTLPADVREFLSAVERDERDSPETRRVARTLREKYSPTA